MRIGLGPFRGEMPRSGRALKPPGFGQEVRNAKLWSGELRPFRAPRAVASLSKVGNKRSLYLWGAQPGRDADGAISAVAGGTPVSVSSAGHGRTTGDRVFIAGTGMAGVDNLIHTITVVNSNQFTLNGTSVAGSSAAGYWIFQNGYWFHWLEDVDAARGTVAQDTLERTYFTGVGAPKMTYAGIATAGGGTNYPNNSYTLGIPKPALAPQIALGAGGGCEVEDQITTAYVYTYVSEIGEEGPPSDPSPTVSYCPGQTLNLSGMSTGPGGTFNITHKRIYRTPFGIPTYQFVAEIPVANSTYADSLLDADLAEDIPSADPSWDMPPSDMHSIGFLSNGIGYGASKNEVCLTPAFYPHAWPDEYRLALSFPIVGIGAFDTHLVACTVGVPSLITGHDPATMTETKYADFEQACVSKRGIVGLDGIGVVYPSPDGLVAVGIGGPSLVTREYFTPDEWRALNPETITAFGHDGRYFGFTPQGGFIFDPREGGAGFIPLDQSCTGGFKDILTDRLYLIVGNFVLEWEGSQESLTYRWKSPLIRTPRPINFGVGQVFADSYSNITFNLYGDGALRHTQEVLNGRTFPLPAGYLAEHHEIEIEGQDHIREVRVAEVVDDMREP